jgi:hypothetical protein
MQPEGVYKREQTPRAMVRLTNVVLFGERRRGLGATALNNLLNATVESGVVAVLRCGGGRGERGGREGGREGEMKYNSMKYQWTSIYR